MVSGAKILFVIGPEGGFTPEEEKVMMENDFLSISLGNSVLRTGNSIYFYYECCSLYRYGVKYMKNFFANAISNELIFVYGLIALVIILIIVIVIN